ncbi:MAG: putative photosynthetic complex assembly protein PuhE [Rhodopila sp.]
MSQYGLPALHSLLIWWVSTCLIMFLDGLPKRTFRWSMMGATAVLGAAVGGLIITANDTSVSGAYWAFTCAVLIWAWLEMSFYMGYATGPRMKHCAHGCGGWRHFWHAVMASLYHEIAIIVLAAVIYGLTRGAANQFGWWTFIVLWWMHQSARLNVFLGVSNLNAEFLPDHLAHIRSFFRHAHMNNPFPFSVTASTICAVFMWQQTAAAADDPFRLTGYVLLTTMMILAILEHWFLVMPISAARIWNSLWQWSLSSRGGADDEQPPNRSVTLPTEATIGGRV